MFVKPPLTVQVSAPLTVQVSVPLTLQVSVPLPVCLPVVTAAFVIYRYSNWLEDISAKEIGLS